ncbi:hypothetical protein TEA_015924 [Camellia sinensis var. sinensis]|uniref:Uncharacterized protein n=1 Tax=Camellia sinensis var. sinensis TaxID=542762 RepID=A0A4S4DZM1_CAMSN|nr:hypothetical protein TEA_015924 [Camellia sinensis var. sinensis]
MVLKFSGMLTMFMGIDGYEVFEEMPHLNNEIYHYHVNKTKSNTNPASDKLLEKLSASTKLTFAHFKEDKIIEVHRSAMVKEGRVSTETVKDEQVDAKADDFINRFRQQLKLQRLDSIRRYKDMINKEGAK